MMTADQFGMQTLESTIRFGRGQERTQVQPAFEHPNARGEADPIWVQSLRAC